MKILLDSCISNKLIPLLKEKKHNVTWAGSWPKDPGDDEILKRAFQEKRILVTLDKDFGEMVIVREKPHAGIIRLVNLSLQKQSESLLYVLKHYKKELQKKAFITLEPGKIRIRV